MTWCKDTTGGTLLAIKLVPRASANRIDGPHGDALKIRLHAPPVDGKANAALLRFLADELDLPLAAIALKTGATGRQKTLLVAGLDAATVRTRLAAGNA